MINNIPIFRELLLHEVDDYEKVLEEINRVASKQVVMLEGEYKF